jgi:hypothetical protein
MDFGGAMAKRKRGIYQLKATLQGLRPPIWRRILIPDDFHLDELHHAIQISMGWTNSHLHQFTLRTKTPRQGRLDYEIALLSRRGSFFEADVLGERVFSDPEFELEDAEDESRARLVQILPKVGAKLEYLYDMGDSWEHHIVLEKILEPNPSISYPCCIAGRRACPPEDCGGVWGYADLIEALGDAKHERHEEVKEWAGEIDPDHFDIDQTNAALARAGED